MRLSIAVLAIVVLPAASAGAQTPPNPAAMLSAERDAMRPLAFLDGIWRGPAWTILPSGEKHSVTQTERIGPFLDSTVRVIEGRGYNADGTVGFNALGIISYNPMTKAYNFHSYAQGFSGDFVMKPTADGYVWEIPAGPATIRYTAVVKGGTFHEVGDRLVAGQPPIRMFDMMLARVGDTTWPAAGAVPAR